jgi:hypothetical protein
MADPMAEPLAASRQRHRRAPHHCGLAAAARAVDYAYRLSWQYAINQEFWIGQREELHIIE